MANVRVAVVGAGSFGKNHLRVIHQSPHAELAGVFDLDSARAAEVAAPYGCPVFRSLEELARHADAAVIATPTVSHSETGCRLMEAGLDLLVEKPIAPTLAEAKALIDTAAKHAKILQIGHLERFNPAIIALEAVMTTPLFFEVHRLSELARAAWTSTWCWI